VIVDISQPINNTNPKNISRMTAPKRTVLITGCSEGGLGSALAIAFHNAGFQVYATARNPAKMQHFAALGIETLTLDVQSASSIAACVSQVPHLDILVNNAGAVYNMPFSDLSIATAKELFDLNVWSYLAVTQAFLPLLIKSKGMIVNQTSSASVVTLPFQSAYTASKAAMAMFSDSQRLELEPFGIRVVDLKTNVVHSNIEKNHKETKGVTLPKDTIYEPAREKLEDLLTAEGLYKDATPADIWAPLVVKELSKKKPSPIFFSGGPWWQTWAVRLGTILPHGTLDGTVKNVTGLDVVEKMVGLNAKQK
jgi:1-acylglycerone phosphate reductase